MDARRLAAMHRTFVPPPALRQSPPRNVRLTATGRFLVAVACAFFTAAIVIMVVLHREARPGGGMPLWLPFLVAAGVAALGGLCLRELHRQRRLLTEGRAAPAVVTKHTDTKDSHGGKHKTITYDFPLLNGAMRTGTSGTSSKPPAVGSVICVVYDPDVPTRNKVYPLSLVTPAT
jgi:hypothetical protein